MRPEWISNFRFLNILKNQIKTTAWWDKILFMKHRRARKWRLTNIWMIELLHNIDLAEKLEREARRGGEKKGNQGNFLMQISPWGERLGRLIINALTIMLIFNEWTHELYHTHIKRARLKMDPFHCRNLESPGDDVSRQICQIYAQVN